MGATFQDDETLNLDPKTLCDIESSVLAVVDDESRFSVGVTLSRVTALAPWR